MADIIAFPSKDERNWRETEAMARETYKDMPDGSALIEECLPKIRALWTETFEPFSVSPTYDIPGPISEQQIAAIKDAVSLGVNLVAERLNKERLAFFGRLVIVEYKEAYCRKHGHSA